MIGAIISLVQLLRRASRPHVAFLGRIPGTRGSPIGSGIRTTS